MTFRDNRSNNRQIMIIVRFSALSLFQKSHNRFELTAATLSYLEKSENRAQFSYLVRTYRLPQGVQIVRVCCLSLRVHASTSKMDLDEIWYLHNM